MNISQKFYIPSFSLRIKRRICLIALPLGALITFILSLILGSSDASLIRAVSALFEGDFQSSDFRIIFYIRLPRALGALFAGAALAVSGIIIQAVLNNPMAAPNVIGVNAGAGFFVIVSMALLPSFIGYLSLAAFIGALLTALIIYAISFRSGADRITLTLIGIAIGSILTAGINTVKTIFPDSVYDVSGFLIGGLASVNFATVLPAGAVISASLILSIVFSPRLDALSLGSEVSGAIGVNVKLSRFLWLILAAALAGAAVSFAGLIGFVGLIVPHIIRRFVGNSHRYLIPVAIFGGSTFLLFADLFSRVIFAPYELPVGIILSLIGGPFFITLVLGRRRVSL